MRRRISKRKSREQISERVSGLFLNFLFVYISSLILGFDGLISFCLITLSDVTLDQCANNSRKLNVVKSRVGFTNITKSLNGI